MQIDHAVITDEFMLFRSNKLWNHERKYKGAFNLYLAEYYTPDSTTCSEYLAHKEYLSTIMENCTTIYPSMDTNYSLLSETSAKNANTCIGAIILKVIICNTFTFISYTKSNFIVMFLTHGTQPTN